MNPMADATSVNTSWAAVFVAGPARTLGALTRQTGFDLPPNMPNEFSLVTLQRRQPNCPNGTTETRLQPTQRMGRSEPGIRSAAAGWEWNHHTVILDGTGSARLFAAMRLRTECKAGALPVSVRA